MLLFQINFLQGTPNQYWVQRFIDHVSINVYPTPDSTNASKDMHFYYIKRIQDVGLILMQPICLLDLYLVWFQV